MPLLFKTSQQLKVYNYIKNNIIVLNTAITGFQVNIKDIRMVSVDVLILFFDDVEEVQRFQKVQHLVINPLFLCNFEHVCTYCGFLHCFSVFC